MLNRWPSIVILFGISASAGAGLSDVATNGSFEQPDIPTDSGLSQPVVPGWDNLPFLFDGDPDGIWPLSGNSGQQYGDIGNIPALVTSQDFIVPANTTLFEIAWFANAADLGAATTTYAVQIQDQGVTTVEQNFTVQSDRESWTAESVRVSCLGPGSYTLRLFGTDGVGGLDALIDDVTILVSSSQDNDNDGVPDSEDNCAFKPNTDQRDTDMDGLGNACDADLDQNCTINFSDLSLMKERFFGNDVDADLDGDGIVNFGDLLIMKSVFFGSPGPSCAVNICE